MMRDLEAYARSEKAELESLIEDSSRPGSAIGSRELIAVSTDAKQLMETEIDKGREMLRRYLADGVIRCAVDQEGRTPPAISGLTSC